MSPNAELTYNVGCPIASDLMTILNFESDQSCEMNYESIVNESIVTPLISALILPFSFIRQMPLNWAGNEWVIHVDDSNLVGDYDMEVTAYDS